jgi:anti-sigma factor RsiW
VDHREDSALSEAIKAQATRYRAPPALLDRVVVALNEVDSVSPRRRSNGSSWQQWFGMSGAFAFGVVASLTVTLFYAAPAQDDRLAQEVISGHVRSLMVAHLADVASSDQHTVKPWFSGKLDFSPPVHDLAAEGFPLVGGRLDYIEQRPVAALVYRRQQHTINVFVWPSGGASTSATKSLSRQGFNVEEWNDSGMQFWAVSDVGAADLQTFVKLLRTAQSAPEPDLPK